MKSTHIQRVINNPNSENDYKSGVLDTLRSSGAVGTFQDSVNYLEQLKQPVINLSILEGDLIQVLVERKPESETNRIIDKFLNHPESDEKIGHVLLWSTQIGAYESAIHRLLDYVIVNKPESNVSIQSVLRHIVESEDAPSSVVKRATEYVIENKSELDISLTEILVSQISTRESQLGNNRLLDYVLGNKPETGDITAANVLRNAIIHRAPDVNIGRLLDYVIEHQLESDTYMNDVLHYAVVKKAPQHIIDRLLDYNIENPSQSVDSNLTHVLYYAIYLDASENTVTRLLDNVLKHQPQSNISMDCLFSCAVSKGAVDVANRIRPFVKLEKDKA